MFPPPDPTTAVVYHNPDDYFSYTLTFNYKNHRGHAFGPNTRGPHNMHAWLQEFKRQRGIQG